MTNTIDEALLAKVEQALAESERASRRAWDYIVDAQLILIATKKAEARIDRKLRWQIALTILQALLLAAVIWAGWA